MNVNLLQYVVMVDACVRDALCQIDKNTKGFVVIVDEDEKALGVLTDGDIRRAFLQGISIDASVRDIYKRNFRFLNISEGIAKACELFKNASIKFLPILDVEGKFVNIITKKQIYSLLLLDIRADLSYDFSKLDENIIDHEIYQRPWGFYKTTVMNDYFQSKVISLNPGAQLSLQSHERREEYWVVAHGRGTVQVDQSIIEVRCGSSVFIPKGCKHRLTNLDFEESLIITEVQIGDYFGEDDIIRYEDKYGRVDNR